jgi:hypothetical protein
VAFSSRDYKEMKIPMVHFSRGCEKLVTFNIMLVGGEKIFFVMP